MLKCDAFKERKFNQRIKCWVVRHEYILNAVLRFQEVVEKSIFYRLRLLHKTPHLPLTDTVCDLMTDLCTNAFVSHLLSYSSSNLILKAAQVIV